MKKLILGITLVAMMVMAANAQHLDFQWSRRANGVIITGYSGIAMNVQIPAQIQGIPVVGIGYSAFREKQLTSVTIPNSVTHIGDGAFWGNQLTNVTIPDSVIHIGYWAFVDNQLTSVTIPDSVLYVGDGAFFGNLLTSITIGRAGIILREGFIRNEGNLRALYSSGGAGTFTRPNADIPHWTRQ